MSMVTDMLLNLASSKSDKIGKKIGKSPQELNQAISKAKQILSQNQNNINVDGAKKIFGSLGIPPSFLDKAYNMAAPFANFIPGLDAKKAKSCLDNIKGGLTENAPVENIRKNEVKFDKTKYPKI